MLDRNLQCTSCGRDYAGDDELKAGDSCPSDDCPEHWEEKGIEHPDFPSQKAMTPQELWNFVHANLMLR